MTYETALKKLHGSAIPAQMNFIVHEAIIHFIKHVKDEDLLELKKVFSDEGGSLFAMIHMSRIIDAVLKQDITAADADGCVNGEPIICDIGLAVGVNLALNAEDLKAVKNIHIEFE